MEAIVLAGGFGTRLRSQVPDLPKPLAPVGGEPFLKYVLDHWIGQGIKRFILATGYKHRVFEKYFGGIYRDVKVDYSVETEPLGTGGGLFLALAKLAGDEDFLVLNGDTFFEVPLASFLEFHRRKSAAVTLAVLRSDKGGRYETVEMDTDSRVLAFRPRAENPRNGYINGGVYLMGREFCNRRNDVSRGVASLESDFFPRWLGEAAAIFSFTCAGRFIDIGTPDSYQAAQKIFGTERSKHGE